MQLRKARRNAIRNVYPCCRCGSDKHITWQHGKTEEEIAQQQFSRENNPKDPLYRNNQGNINNGKVKVEVEVQVQSPVAEAYRRACL